MKKVNRTGCEQGHQSTPNPHNRRDGNSRRRNKFGDNSNNYRGESSKGIQCKECERFALVQDECANTLKKKALMIDEEDDVTDEDIIKNYYLMHEN